ncbi:MAG: oligosaccharide flippase family protein [Hyphomicrobium sp.]|nr:oligosaccharide flippase family protein [Hyphomicrobium sp.]
MNTNAKIVRATFWTAATYAASIVLRFGSNVVLSRLLTPETLGVLLIVNTVRQGIELSSDIGLAQNVVQNKSGGTARFLNTIWVLQILRGVAQSALVFVSAVWIAGLYNVPVLAFELSAGILVVGALASTSLFLMHRNMQIARMSLFEVGVDAIGASIAITAALLSPTVTSLLIAAIVSQAMRTLLTHLIGEESNKLQFSREYAREILQFGRWIFLSSIVIFLCASFDRLYIGKVAPLALVGIYGLARGLSDLPAAMVARIGYSVIFPIVSANQSLARSDARSKVARVRFAFLLAAASIIAFCVSFADVVVALIYDARYHDAAWMLPILLCGVWLAILCSINEYVLLGFGKPAYNMIGNIIKLIYYVVFLPLAFQAVGMVGIVMVVSGSEVGRYLALAVGQKRENFSFIRQDLIASLLFVALVALFSWLRLVAGFGTAFSTVPLEFGWLLGRPS